MLKLLALPDELVTEILVRLPVLYLVKFPVVCKAWVIHDYESRIYQNAFECYNFPGDPSEFHFIPKPNQLSEAYKSIILWNPATFKLKELPSTIIGIYSDDYSTVGFGFDSKADDYKVVRFLEVDNDRSIRAEAYSANEIRLG
ncbi:hypothetical protein POM88_037135 [Heracleum sosnowskyi]|uniref:F-box domain-containing protein n=1 Tax=Heracleum sosnowskyi TaxID=360622 RepID=A0AAD8MGD4_9APIA|nr:hypothetical protein POM88_037135 [Heracleum sosnowskyi]